MSNSSRPHGLQPTRLPHPWDSPGKNTGVGCHFLLQCMKVKSESEVTQLCPTHGNAMDCSRPLSMGFSRQEHWSGVRLPSPKSQLAVSNLASPIWKPGSSESGLKRMRWMTRSSLSDVLCFTPLTAAACISHHQQQCRVVVRNTGSRPKLSSDKGKALCQVLGIRR